MHPDCGREGNAPPPLANHLQTHAGPAERHHGGVPKGMPEMELDQAQIGMEVGPGARVGNRRRRLVYPQLRQADLGRAASSSCSSAFPSSGSERHPTFA